MPRPSTTADPTETSIPAELPQRMNSTPNSSFAHSSEHLNSNSSLVSPHLHPQLSLPDEISSSSIPIFRTHSTQFDDLSMSRRNLSSPTDRHPSPVASPIPAFQPISLLKSSVEQNSNEMTTPPQKRKQIDEEDAGEDSPTWIQLATK